MPLDPANKMFDRKALQQQQHHLRKKINKAKN
jgi:hypothetical protein